MPSFKPKTSKKIVVSKKNATTLDGKHKEFMNEFIKDEYHNIPTLKEERCLLKEKLQTFHTYENRESIIDEIMNIKDRIKEINILISDLKTKKTDYFLDNSKYIFEYFENKKNISNVDNPPVVSKNTLLNNFFKIKNNKDKETNKNDSQQENTTQSIVQKYLSNIDESFLDMNSFVVPTDICQKCYKGELIPLDDEGVLICNNCAVNFAYLIENEKPSYKEPPKEVCFYAYKKINHFKEILAQFQGKETTLIPSEVIEMIKQQIKKERIKLEQLTHYKTKEILKKLGFNKYYEHIAFIKNQLGLKPPVMSPELEETLCNLFMELQSPYSKNCPDYRVNFLNYYYVLYKLCEILGEKHYLTDIPMLKDREKLIEQDETWKKMCEELDWEFIPTI
jgi:hypothetical protein